eukprot:CAMPEP_0203757936 /NCGR_PEP_ID=MMETSP0098-20131031/10767_1 /ASSEMBLY_ACC=CAM_ASM_000208 /TAXON_ID=96639 /ORGANISM=" , Strain NY0313808BC1" /LENGTH=590 /DNA_ID=CAMNT_0050650181 /DNA_START=63 /DNA_END=1835 /DNA_ORIENTATION=-
MVPLVVRAALCACICASYGRSDVAPAVHTIPLYGDLSKLGYVYSKAAVGKEGNNTFRMAVDTGTTLSFLPCTGCRPDTCGKERVKNLVNQKHSTKTIKCWEKICPANGEKCAHLATGGLDSCVIKRESEDPDPERIEGVYSLMNVSLAGSYQVEAPLGCITSMEGDYMSQTVDGVLGLGYKSGILDPVNGWSLCLARNGFFGGNLSLGFDETAAKKLKWAKLHVPHMGGGGEFESDYKIGAHAPQMRLGGKDLSGGGDMHIAIRSASRFTWLPMDLFKNVRKALYSYCDKKLKNGKQACAGNVRVTGDSQSVGCFDTSGHSKEIHSKRRNMHESRVMKNNTAVTKDVTSIFTNLGVYETFPPISFWVRDTSNNGIMRVEPMEYLYKYKESIYCVGMLKVESKTSETITLGSNVLRGWNVTVDVKNEKVSLNQCLQNFQLVSESHDLDEDNSQGSSSAQAGIGSFLVTFSLTLITLCFCRCLCMNKTSSSYQAVDGEFGNGDYPSNGRAHNGSHEHRLESAKFSIGSMEDEEFSEIYDHELQYSDEDDIQLTNMSSNGHSKRNRKKKSSGSRHHSDEVEDLVQTAKDLLAD